MVRARALAQESELQEGEGVHVGIAELDGPLQFGAAVQKPVVTRVDSTRLRGERQLPFDHRLEVGSPAALEVAASATAASVFASDSSAFSSERREERPCAEHPAQARGAARREPPPPRGRCPGRTIPGGSRGTGPTTNTHGIARRSSRSSASAAPRDTGREAIRSVPICAIGVTRRKNATKPSARTSARYASSGCRRHRADLLGECRRGIGTRRRRGRRAAPRSSSAPGGGARWRGCRNARTSPRPARSP